MTSIRLAAILAAVFLLARSPGALASAGRVEEQQDASPSGFLVEPVEDGIVGIVIDENGEPLADVEVGVRKKAYVYPPPYERSGRPLFDEPRTLEEALAVARERWEERQGVVLVARTGPDGVFRFAGVDTESVYAFAASRPGYFSKSHVYECAAGESLVVRMVRTHLVEFVVERPDGVPVEEAVFRIRRGSSTSGETWRSDRPAVEFEDGRVTIQVYAGALRYTPNSDPVGEFASDAFSIDPGLVEGPVTVRLERRRGIEVLARDPWVEQGGSGRRSIVVRRLAPDESFDPDDPELVAYETRFESPLPIQRTRLSAYFDDLAPGRYAVALQDGERVLDAKEVVLDEGGALVRLRAPDRSREGRIVVDVRDTAGARVVEPRIVLDQRVDGRWVKVDADVERAPTREMWLAPQPISGRATSLRVTAIDASFGMVSKEIAVDDRGPVALAFPRGGVLVVALEGLDETVVASSVTGTLRFVGRGDERTVGYVAYLPLDGRARPHFGSEGIARCEGLPPGRWSVALDYLSHGTSRIHVDAGEVEVREGEVVTMRVAAPRVVEVVVDAGASNAGLELVLAHGSDWTTVARGQVDLEGICRLGWLAEGSYRLGAAAGYPGSGIRDARGVKDVVVDGSTIEWRGR
ncbi:MAG: hypothetical protein R3F34_02390 [Planctomycetota bacterium]